MSAAVEVRGARVGIGGAEVLRGLDLALGEREVLVVLGPSGSGKTTLLRAIAGFLDLDGGTISLGGVEASDPKVKVPPERRGVGMVFQNLALWPHLTVAGHLEFVLKSRGLARADRARRAAELLDLARLSGKERRVPSELSGGEAQRLALARALAGEPKVLLLDEPLGHVDEALRADLAAELVALQRRTGLPTIHVTHDQGEGLSVADRVAVLRAGRVEQEGTPESVFRRPATPFVARFVGKHNVFPGLVEAGRVRTPLGDLPAPPGAAGKVAVAIRPDSLAIGNEGTEARVSSCFFESGEWAHRLACNGLELRAIARRAFPAGESVRVRIAGEALILPEEACPEEA